MKGLREWTDIALIAMAASYKWALGGMAVIAVIVGGLYFAGVFSGEEDASGDQAADITQPGAVPTPLPTATAMPDDTPVPIVLATPFPTLAPSLTATPGLVAAATPIAPQMVQVPINLQDAYQVGSLEFVLSYEPSLLEFTGLTNGDLAGDAIIESRVSSPGRLWIGMIDANGVSGDGSVALVSFRTTRGTIANSPLVLEDVSGFDASTFMDLLSRPSPGLFVANDGSYTAPVLNFQ